VEVWSWKSVEMLSTERMMEHSYHGSDNPAVKSDLVGMGSTRTS